jgi:hypothetical protein
MNGRRAGDPDQFENLVKTKRPANVPASSPFRALRALVTCLSEFDGEIQERVSLNLAGVRMNWRVEIIVTTNEEGLV